MRLLTWLLDLLYPPRCIFCRSFLERDGPGICLRCSRELPRTTNFGRQKGRNFSICVSPLYYEGVVRDCVLRYKFHGAAAYAPACASLMAECIRDSLDGRYDLISWVPLSKKRLRKRGYDQARLLAEAAAAQLGVPAVPTLSKVRNTRVQSRTGGAQQRRKNVVGAYTALNESVAGKRILLIDDVITTGATLSECAGALRRAGAKEILCCTFARKRD